MFQNNTAVYIKQI